MSEEIVLSDAFNRVYVDINDLIRQKKCNVKNAVNDAMISLYWGIGKKLTEEITGVNKPEYGKKVVVEISNRLSADYGAGFNKSGISRMISFYQEFPNYEKVATLSQQLTWSHFIEILPIKDELKRDFYAAMCKNENWSVRTLRERKKSMLYERTAISKKPDETIELMELDNGSIHVAQYLTKMPPKEVLEKKLLQAIANAKEQLAQREK